MITEKENQHIVTDQEVDEIKSLGIKVSKRLQDSEFELITNYVYNVIDFVMRRNRGKDVNITLNQIADIMGVNKMTVWAHIKRLKKLNYFETYYDGIPRRQFYVNHYKPKEEV